MGKRFCIDTSQKKYTNSQQASEKTLNMISHQVNTIKTTRHHLTVTAAKLLSHFSCVRLCATPQTAAHQAPPSLGFSRQEHCSGLPFPSPMHESEKWKGSCSVVSDSSRPHGLQPTRLLHPWDFSRQEYWSGLPLPSPQLLGWLFKKKERKAKGHKFWQGVEKLEFLNLLAVKLHGAASFQFGNLWKC